MIQPEPQRKAADEILAEPRCTLCESTYTRTALAMSTAVSADGSSPACEIAVVRPLAAGL